MKRSNKKLFTLLLVFALVFVMGGVYAAASGVLTFQGVANLNDSSETDTLKLEIFNAKVLSADGESTGDVRVSEDGQTMTVTAYLDKPGDAVNITYDIRNVGTLDAYLDEWKIDSPDNDLTKALEISKPTGSHSVVKANGTTGTSMIYVKWNEDAEEYAGQTMTWTYTINYMDNNAR